MVPVTGDGRSTRGSFCLPDWPDLHVLFFYGLWEDAAGPADVPLHVERQVEVGTLDLVLSLQVGHAIGVHAIDGHDHVPLRQVTRRCFTPGCDLE